jgi:hypothetical protein
LIIRVETTQVNKSANTYFQLELDSNEKISKERDTSICTKFKGTCFSACLGSCFACYTYQFPWDIVWVGTEGTPHLTFRHFTK